MSRSFKKHYKVKDPADKGMKRAANKKVRHSKELPKKGRSYKKVFESYKISDWSWYWSKEKVIADWNASINDEDRAWIRDHFKTLEKYLIYWEKCVKRK